jgi:hypothetical protein
MCKHGDFLFIGTSKLRKSSTTFKALEIDKEADKAGIVVVHLPSAKVVASMQWHNSVDEIYDIQVLPDTRRANILNTYQDTHHKALMLPNTTYWSKEKPKPKS